jgi:glucans biosynthesis protein C
MDSTISMAANGERRIDLDWVRIIAFALLIWYHVTSFYAAVTPHNQALSPRVYGWLVVPMLALSPWRLLPPLLLVTAVIVPPISFVTVQQWYGYRGSLVDFLGHYFTADNHFCRAGHCMPVPLPNPFRLWFALYLWTTSPSSG